MSITQLKGTGDVEEGWMEGKKGVRVRVKMSLDEGEWRGEENSVHYTWSLPVQLIIHFTTREKMSRKSNPDT